jgi:hypothetical protein
VRFIERLEGPHYPEFVASDFAQELRREGLEISRTEQVSDFGDYWLCAPTG